MVSWFNLIEPESPQEINVIYLDRLRLSKYPGSTRLEESESLGY